MKIIAVTKTLDGQPTPATEPIFPSVRYFQIHFEHLEEMIGDLREQIDQAHQRIAELQRQLQAKSSLEEICFDSDTSESQAQAKLEQ